MKNMIRFAAIVAATAGLFACNNKINALHTFPFVRFSFGNVIVAGF